MKHPTENQSEKILSGRTSRVVLWMLCGLLILTVLVRFAEPTKDGDIFFHLVYGKAIVENKTLTPDHTIYSWTDAVDDQIYCAWLGQVFLYIIHKTGGFTLLFLFRYACLFLAIGILWAVLRKHRFHDPAFPVLMLLLVSISFYTGVFLKPEIFSLVLMAVLAFLYFQAKLRLFGTRSYKLLLCFPVLMVFWINTHGVWMFGFIILSILLAGEILNKYAGRPDSSDPMLLKYLFVSYLVTLPLLLFNPYGWSYAIYPVYGIMRVIMPSAALNNAGSGLKDISAYKNLFSTLENPAANLVSIWITMLVIFLLLYGYYMVVQKKRDWAVLLLNVALGALFLIYVRSTYYWGSFWCLSCVFLLSRSGNPVFRMKKKFQYTIKGLTIGCILIFSALTIYNSVFIPFKDNWLGFGLNSWAPVDEALFLKKNKPGRHLYNSYKTGAYLLFDLYPVYKVFIDARRFPYTGLIQDYLDFQNGIVELEAFNQKYPFDVALVDYTYDRVFLQFFNSKKWWPVYYGSAAVIFVQQEKVVEFGFKDMPLNRFDRLNNLENAGKAFTIAMNFNDLDAAEYILDRIRKKFRHIRGYQMIVADALNKVGGLKAYQSQEYDTAYHLLSKSDDQTVVRITQILIHLRVQKIKQLVAEEKYTQALDLMEMNLKRMPRHPEFLYAAGVIAYFSQGTFIENERKSKQYFNRFISLYPDHAQVRIARQILEGGKNLSIPLGL